VKHLVSKQINKGSLTSLNACLQNITQRG